MASDAVRDGIFAVNKPCGMSSAHVIRECQKSFNPSSLFKSSIEAEIAKRQEPNIKQKARRRAAQVKIGHGGTLDPLATGVLILGIGSGTKELAQFLDCTKTYEATVLFGASTDTYDRVGRIISKRPYDHITKEKALEALESFKGKQIQIPPLYSALKMNGKPLYEYAREGKPIPRKLEGREVEVKEIELLEWYEPGNHNHRWPVEQAEAAERNLAEQVWRVKRAQETSKPLTPEQKEEDDQAIAAHESFKRKFEERQDELVRDSPSKRSRHNSEPALMSGALGQFPQAQHSDRGANLIPESRAENAPPPWTDKGPPAMKVRMTVTSGYYVRSFCHDVGAKLESAALMAELCRTRQSDFTVGGVNCLEFDDLSKGEEVWGPQVADMLSRWNAEPEGQWRGSEATSKSTTTSGKGSELNSKSTHKKDDKNTIAQRRSRSRSPNSQKDFTAANRGEKRQRSPSAASGNSSPPRKAQARSPRAESGSQAPLRSGNREDDEKSWNGIED